MRKEFSIDQVSLKLIWLENGKKSDFNPSFHIPFVDIRNLNRKQNVAYKISLVNHFRSNVSSPLLMISTGQGGSCKSFVVNALRRLLHSYCIASSYFDIATLNINGITLIAYKR